MRNHVLTAVALVLCRVATGWKPTRDVCKTDLIIKNKQCECVLNLLLSPAFAKAWGH